MSDNINDESFVRQDNEGDEVGIQDEFHWSVESDGSDHEEDNEAGHGSVGVEGNESGQGSGVVEGFGSGQGSGGEERFEGSQGSAWVEYNEVGEEMFEYNEDSSYEGSTDNDDAMSRFSKHMKGQQFAYGADGKIYLKVGQVFEGVDHFRKVFQDYVIQKGFSVKKIYNQKRRFKAKCKQADCPFHLYAAMMADDVSYQIRKFEETHTCMRVYNNKEATSSWVVEKMGDFIRSQKGSSIKPLVDELGRKHFLQLSRSKLYRANKQAKGRSDKLHAESFAWLLKYDHIIKHTNPGSMYNVKIVRPEGVPNFQRCFLGFAAQKKGFIEGCRHFIGVDGCHLKGPYGGVLLSAVSMDANSGIFPVAIAICEIENKESWRYFMSLLKEFVRDIDPITIMSDRQKGLVDAIQTCWPNANVRHCARHVYANFRKKFPGLRLRNLFWAVSRAANTIDFQQAIENVEIIDREAHRWMIENDVNSWSRHAFDLDSKSDHVTNNMCEVFNSWLGENRELPILSLLEHYRRRIMVQMQARAKVRTDWVTTIPPTIHKKLNSLFKLARNVETIWPGSDEFEVLDQNCHSGRHYILNLQHQTCDCGIWQLSGVPCVHAVRCLHFRNIRNIEDYVDPSLSITSYIKTYADHIHPIPDPLSWPDFVKGRKLNPPIKHSKIGRPKKARKKDVDEEPRLTKGATLKCGICRTLGHNRRRCPQNPPNNKQ